MTVRSLSGSDQVRLKILGNSGNGRRGGSLRQSDYHEHALRKTGCRDLAFGGVRGKSATGNGNPQRRW